MRDERQSSRTILTYEFIYEQFYPDNSKYFNILSDKLCKNATFFITIRSQCQCATNSVLVFSVCAYRYLKIMTNGDKTVMLISCFYENVRLCVHMPHIDSNCEFKFVCAPLQNEFQLCFAYWTTFCEDSSAQTVSFQSKLLIRYVYQSSCFVDLPCEYYFAEKHFVEL